MPLTVLVLVLSVAGCAAPAEVTEVAPSAGYQSGDGTVTTWAPDERGEPVLLTGTDFEGRAVDTTAWLGSPVVLNTWYAACPPCRAEAPDLVQIAHDYADRGVRLLGINGVDDAGAAQAFQRTFEVPYPSLQDTDAQAVAHLQAVVPVQAVPTTVVLDSQGRVAGRWTTSCEDRSTAAIAMGDVPGNAIVAGVLLSHPLDTVQHVNSCRADCGTVAQTNVSATPVGRPAGCDLQR